MSDLHDFFDDTPALSPEDQAIVDKHEAALVKMEREDAPYSQLAEEKQAFPIGVKPNGELNRAGD